MHPSSPDGRRRRWISGRRWLLPVGAAAVLGLSLVLPFALAQNAWFEWANPYWFLTVDIDSIRQTGLPTRFLSSHESGVLYPQFVFYSGGALAVLGYLGVVIGSWAAFTGALVAAVMAGATGAYLGARALQLGRGPACALAAAGSAAPYMVTNIYGRGAWAEVLGAGAAWLMIGSGLWFLRTGPSVARGRVALTAVMVATAWLAVSHNISLLLGTAFAILIWGVLAREVTPSGTSAWRRGGLLTGAYSAGLGLAAAWLLPNLRYSSDTLASSWRVVGTAAPFDRLSIVFAPWLRFPEDQRAITARAFGQASQERLFNQTASLLIIIALVGVAFRLLAPSLRKVPLARQPVLAGAGLAAIACCTGVVMTQTSLLASAPGPLQAIQFAYRLNPYLTYTLVLLAALALRSSPRRFAASIAVTTACWYLGLAAYQISTARPVAPPGTPLPQLSTISAGTPPPSFADGTAAPVQFRFVPADPVKAPRTRVTVDEHGIAVAGSTEIASSSNVVCTPFVAAVQGTVIVGTDEAGLCVMNVGQRGAKAAEAAWPVASVAGLLITALVIIAGASAGSILLVRRIRNP